MRIAFKASLILFIISIFIACNTQKTAQNKLNKLQIEHPELFDKTVEYVIKTDTIEIVKPEVKIDTVILSNDNIFIENDQMAIEIHTIFDSITVKGICKSDTLYFYDVDTVSVINEAIVTEVVRVKYVPLYYKVLFFLWLLFMIRVIMWGYLDYLKKKFKL